MENTKSSMYPPLSLKAPIIDAVALALIALAYIWDFVDWLVAHEPYLKVGVELLTITGLLWRGGAVLIRQHRRRLGRLEEEDKLTILPSLSGRYPNDSAPSPSPSPEKDNTHERNS